MKYFVIDNIGKWADRKLLGLLPTARAVFQARAAGAREVTILTVPDGRTSLPAGLPGDVAVSLRQLEDIPETIESLADRLGSEANEPIFVVDARFIFQRDFATTGITKTGNTVFSAEGQQVGAFRTGDGTYGTESADGRAYSIETPRGLKSAKKMLYQGLKKPLLVNGLVAAYIQRPMAHIVTVAIVNTPIRPNHVTLFAMLVGLSGAAMLFLAGANEWIMRLGLLMYFMGSVFDCVDGDLARLKHQGSYLGSWLDTIADDSSTTAILLALGYYVAQATGEIWWLAFGGGAALVFLLGESYIYWHLLKIYHSGDVLDFVWASGVKKRASAESIVDYLMLFVKRDFFTLALLVMGMFSVVHWGLVWLSVMMYLYGGYVLVDIILSLRKPGWRTRQGN